MEGNDITNNFFSVNLPFSNCSEAQIEFEFLGERKTLYEKYSGSKFFKDMAEYANTLQVYGGIPEIFVNSLNYKNINGPKGM